MCTTLTKRTPATLLVSANTGLAHILTVLLIEGWSQGVGARSTSIVTSQAQRKKGKEMPCQKRGHRHLKEMPPQGLKFT